MTMRFAPIILLALAGCAAKADPPPSELRKPDSRLTAKPSELPKLSPLAQGNSEMWGAYGQCVVSRADEIDRRRGLVDYVTAIGAMK